MEKECKICGKKYNAKQERSFFCSGACRQKSHRNKVTKTVTATKKEIKELQNELSEERKNKLERAILIRKKIIEIKQSRTQKLIDEGLAKIEKMIDEAIEECENNE